MKTIEECRFATPPPKKPVTNVYHIRYEQAHRPWFPTEVRISSPAFWMSVLFLSKFTKICSLHGAVLIVCIIFVLRVVTPPVFPFERKPCNGLVVLRWAKWAWKEKRSAFYSFICRASVIDEWMRIRHWCSDTRRIEVLGKKPLPVPFCAHTSHILA